MHVYIHAYSQKCIHTPHHTCIYTFMYACTHFLKYICFFAIHDTEEVWASCSLTVSLLVLGFSPLMKTGLRPDYINKVILNNLRHMNIGTIKMR